MNKETKEMPRVMMAIDAAEYLGLPYPTVLKMIKSGVIPAMKYGSRYFVASATLVRTFGLNEPAEA